MELGEDSEELERIKLNQETARIPWSALQRFFAQGHVVWVSNDLDLIEVASWLSRDRTPSVTSAMEQGAVARVSDEQARCWSNAQASLWAVVVRPWVLVQEGRCESGSTPTPVQG
jgi:hypothetical protein